VRNGVRAEAVERIWTRYETDDSVVHLREHQVGQT